MGVSEFKELWSIVEAGDIYIVLEEGNYYVEPQDQQYGESVLRIFTKKEEAKEYQNYINNLEAGKMHKILITNLNDIFIDMEILKNEVAKDLNTNLRIDISTIDSAQTPITIDTIYHSNQLYQ